MALSLQTLYMEQPTYVQYLQEGFYSQDFCCCSVTYRTLQGFLIMLHNEGYYNNVVMYEKSVRQVQRKCDSRDFVMCNNLWMIGEYYMTRMCLSAAVWY